jgi:hypothetical protein
MHILPLVIATMFFSLAPMAQDSSAGGSFDSEFEVVADNCKGEGLKLGKGTVKVSENGKQVNVKIPELPTLSGRTGRKGKIRAEATAPTKTPGLSARYGLNARITSDALQGVFVAEYFRASKPQCTQSFSITGKRSRP